ncbi:myeloid leukemia factor 1 [Denticeps clupeoides]|uniref:Myeloid leukemia factor 1 n=1 Tax=Denticeps clupeoides TaxID=299321 RepID=A0AAY4DX08_9TELE|nr:myeloid leukemia factor 1 [Denticeps clupeoides]
MAELRPGHVARLPARSGLRAPPTLLDKRGRPEPGSPQTAAEMFNSLLRDVEDDPFVSDPFRAHSEHMRHMMRSFSDPFGHGFMPSLTDGRDRQHRPGRGQPGTNVALRDNHRDNDFFRNPFAMMDNMMMGMRNRMEDVHRNIDNVSTDPSTHSFSSSSVMTYSKVGNDPPKVFQASSQTRQAPGGIREIRRSVKDSESGLEKMSIGHHINDRAHVVERKRNHRTGEQELNQDFQNMDESEAQAFDDEWRQEVSKFHPSAPMSHLEAPKPRAVHRAAIAGPENSRRVKKSGGEKSHYTELQVQGTSMKEK